MDTSALLDWWANHGELAVSLGSAVMATIAAGLAWRETRRQRRLQSETLRQQVDAASVDWGRRAIDALCEAVALAQASHLMAHEQAERRSSLAARLSALVDEGRLFFPNVDPDDHGTDKTAAFRGRRPPILDALIYAYHEVRLLDRPAARMADSAAYLVDCRRLLVSELQAHLDPRRLEAVIGRYASQRTHLREEALRQAGRLGVRLDVRRPGLLGEAEDEGWTAMIGAAERKAMLRAHGPQSGAHG